MLKCMSKHVYNYLSIKWNLINFPFIANGSSGSISILSLGYSRVIASIIMYQVHIITYSHILYVIYQFTPKEFSFHVIDTQRECDMIRNVDI